jgi:hypothetical protein
MTFCFDCGIERALYGVQHKFGRYHARIIRLLLDKKCLDEKTVCSASF